LHTQEKQILILFIYLLNILSKVFGLGETDSLSSLIEMGIELLNERVTQDEGVG
jgi:hypothetical protein